MSTAELTAMLLKIQKLEAKLATIPAQPNYNEPLDAIWMLVTGDLVWFMSAGFCFLEMGSLRPKHAQNVLAKNIIVPVVAFICWYFMGYALAFGYEIDKPNKFIGGTFFVMHGFWDSKSQFRQWFFQGAFCDTSASIVSGGIAERMSMFGYIMHTVFMTGFIYPVVVYWAWSGSGWLNYIGDDGMQTATVGPWYKDWAGSGVIHFVGGVAALVGAVVVGPRVGRFSAGSKDEDFTPHSVPFTVLGTFVLWLGWFGFNPGCTLQMHTDMAAYTSAIAAVNSAMAPGAGGLVAWLLTRYVLPPYHYNVPAMCNGILAGLVGVTAPSGFVKTWEAIIIGAVSGFLYVFACIMWRKLKIDDPIDALSVHLVCGAWGTIAVGFFGDKEHGLGGNGVFYGGNQVGIQFLALLVFGAWSGILSFLVFFPLQKLGLLRWSDEIQLVGSDIMQHSPPKAYTDHIAAAAAAPAAGAASPASGAATPKSTQLEITV